MYGIFISAGSWLNASMKKEDRTFAGKDVNSSFVSTQKQEQSGGWGTNIYEEEIYI